MSDNLKRAESLFNRIINQGKEVVPENNGSRDFGRHNYNYNGVQPHYNQHHNHGSYHNNHGTYHNSQNHNQNQNQNREHRKHKPDLVNHKALKLPDQILESLQGQSILPYCWTIWHHLRTNKSDIDYLQTTQPIEFPKYNSKDVTKYVGSLEQMWVNLGLIKLPLELIETEYLIFKSGINPVWEDPFNTKGGRWIFKFNKVNQDGINNTQRVNLIWETMIVKLMTGSFISVAESSTEVVTHLLNDINGITLSVRKDVDIISLWNSNLTKFVKNAHTRRLLCECIINIIKECDLKFNNGDQNDNRIKGVVFEYRVHNIYNKK